MMQIVNDPLTGRPTILVRGPRGGKPPWKRPAHIRQVRRRKHTYLVCRCGKERRVTVYYTTRRAAERGDGFLDPDAMYWCDKTHGGCA